MMNERMNEDSIRSILRGIQRSHSQSPLFQNRSIFSTLFNKYVPACRSIEELHDPVTSKHQILQTVRLETAILHFVTRCINIDIC